MKKRSMRQMIMAGALGLMMLAAPFTALANDGEWGAVAAQADENVTLEEMLIYALQDEYLAHAEYEMILEAYGTVKPFSNIVKAESKHISLLLPLFRAYEIEVPVDDAAERIELPASLEESYAAGVEAEILNIAMYQRFLKEDLPEDVKVVFEKLMAASMNHLKAFERAVDRDGAIPAEGKGKAGGSIKGRRSEGNGSKMEKPGRALGWPAERGRGQNGTREKANLRDCGI